MSEASTDPTGLQPPSASVTDLPSAEFLTLSGLASTVGTAVGLASTVAPHLRSARTLAVQLLDSVATESHHLVTWRVTNLTAYGLYVDRVQMIDPEGVVGRAERISRSMGMDSESEAPPPALPLRVAPTQAVDLLLRIDLLDRDRFASRPYATVRLIYSRLDQRHSETAEFVVLLRW